MDLKVRLAMLIGLEVGRLQGNVSMYERRGILIDSLRFLTDHGVSITTEDTQAIEMMVNDALAHYRFKYPVSIA